MLKNLLSKKNCFMIIEYIACQTTMANTKSTIASTILHDAKNKVFELNFKENLEKGYISYAFVDETTLDLQHTFVPESLRGRGIAKELAKYAFEYVVNNDLKMKLSCTYLDKYFKEHPLPEYQSRVIS